MILRGRPTAVFASECAIPEHPLRGAPLAAAHTAGKHVGTLEFSGAFSYSKMKPDHGR